MKTGQKTENKKQRENYKSQIPSSKLQTNYNIQVPNSKNQILNSNI